jgi:hypothetical protein
MQAKIEQQVWVTVNIESDSMQSTVIIDGGSFYLKSRKWLLLLLLLLKLCAFMYCPIFK